MNKIQTNNIPRCDIPGCDRRAKYDAPTRSGRWAYLCASCAQEHKAPGDIGSEFVPIKVKKTSGHLGTATVQGTLMDSVLTYECPGCGTERRMELDAWGVDVVCEGCGGTYTVSPFI